MKSFGARFGYAASFLTALLLSLPFLIFGSQSTRLCDPMPQCRPRAILEIFVYVATSLAIAALAGLFLRWIVNEVAAHRDDRGRSNGFVLSALASVLLTAFIATVVAFAVLERIHMMIP